MPDLLARLDVAQRDGGDAAIPPLIDLDVMADAAVVHLQGEHSLIGLQVKVHMPSREIQGLGLKLLLTCWREPSLRISPGAPGTS